MDDQPTDLERDMVAAAREVHGSGWTTDYYRGVAAAYAVVAEGHLADQRADYERQIAALHVENERIRERWADLRERAERAVESLQRIGGLETNDLARYRHLESKAGGVKLLLSYMDDAERQG